MQSPSRQASVRASAANRDSSHSSPSMPPHVLAALAHPARMRSDESWVEISSRPSSSSLSSAAADEIVTTGLRVQRGTHARLPKRRRAPLARSNLHPAPAGSRSSQDEYDETESEEDRIMTSSNEHLPADASPSDGSARSEAGDDPRDDEDDDDDDDDDDDADENSTALGVGQATVFTPQPNVFSHPPRSPAGTRSDPVSYFSSRNGHRPASGGPPSTRHPQHSPYNLIAPSHQADHDAALRASLSTLLSCAAAARGLSKPARFAARTGPAAAGIGGGGGHDGGVQPGTLQIVSESALLGTEPSHDSAKSDPSSGVGPTLEERDHDEMVGRFGPRTKTKRKSLASPAKGSRSSSKEHQPRVTKKAKGTALLEDSISPSLLTWVLSAGVVVLVSAISFSAGYAMGKEVGRAEVSVMDLSDESRNCGREAVRGLRRFRWSTGRTGTVVG